MINMKKIIKMLSLVISILFLFNGCVQSYEEKNETDKEYVFVSYDSVERMLRQNKALFTSVGKECISDNWCFACEDEGKIRMFWPMGDGVSIDRTKVADEHYNNIKMCFSIMQKVVKNEDGIDFERYSFNISPSEDAIDDRRKVDFCFYDDEDRYGVYLTYSEDDFTDYPDAKKIADNWYIWSWGDV